MLIGEDDFVEVGRDFDLFVGEVIQPGSLAADGVGQQGEDFAGRYGDHVRLDVVLERFVGHATGVFRTVVNPQMSSCHVDASLRRVP